ncbi:MAG: hypothetical protein WDZ59_17675 [Pirellulales bacterium]
MPAFRLAAGRNAQTGAPGRTCAGALLALLLLPALSVAQDSSTADQRARLLAEHAQRLEELATDCRREGLADAAKSVSSWLPQREPATLYLFLPSERSRQAERSQSDPPPDWQRRFDDLREQQAQALFGLATQAASGEQPWLAVELVSEALREDPDHEAARSVFGHQLVDGAWRTPFEMRMLRGGQIWHERYGWIDQDDLPRYESGLERIGTRWVAVDTAAQAHRDIRRGWQIRTEHYQVTTNHSLAEGASLATRLEKLQSAFRIAFPRYPQDEPAMARLRGESARPANRRPHEVYHFRTRDQYNAALRPLQSRIDMTLGIYFDTMRRAYFFAGADAAAGTLYHEATHQLIQETRPTETNVARRHNFWIVEGIAVYAESLIDHGRWWTLGGPNAARVPAARHNLLAENFYVPLAELTQLGMHELQRHPHIAKLYSQAAGLVTFLMHYDDGRYRGALAEYLIAVYSGKDNADTLATLTGVDYDQLDRQYREFMQQGL